MLTTCKHTLVTQIPEITTLLLSLQTLKWPLERLVCSTGQFFSVAMRVRRMTLITKLKKCQLCIYLRHIVEALWVVALKLYLLPFLYI